MTDLAIYALVGVSALLVVGVPTAALALWRIDARMAQEATGRLIGFLFARRFTKP